MADDFPKTEACPAGPTVSVPGDAQPSPPLSSSSLQEVTSQPVMGFDPLPPLDSIISYTRPERYPHLGPAGTALLPVTMPSASGWAARRCSVLLSSSTWEEERPWLVVLADRQSVQAGLVLLLLPGAAGGCQTAASHSCGGKGC